MVSTELSNIMTLDNMAMVKVFEFFFFLALVVHTLSVFLDIYDHLYKKRTGPVSFVVFVVCVFGFIFSLVGYFWFSDEFLSYLLPLIYNCWLWNHAINTLCY